MTTATTAMAAPASEPPEVTTSPDQASSTAGWEPPPTSMPASERARVWWLRAQELERARRFRESANAYRRSYEATPTLAALYNMALAHDYARQPLDAIASYRRYVEEVEVDALDRTQVLDRISELEGEVARIVVAPPDNFDAGVVTIDGDEVALAQDGNLVLPGPHDIVLRDAQDRTSRQRVVVVAGTRVVVRFDDAFKDEAAKTLPPKPRVDPVAVEVSPRERQRMRALRRGMWVTVGLTAASGSALLGVGLATIRAKSDFEASLCDGPCPEGVTYDADAASRFYRLRTASNVLVGITTASALTLTVLAILGADRREQGRGGEGMDRAAQRASGVRLRPTLGGLQLDF